MGYTTDFQGEITITPPLNAYEIEYLNKFNNTRRMDRTSGPYFVEGTGFHGQGHDGDIHDFNTPPEGQPGLWCQWVPTPDGTALQWDEGEKFYNSEEWMAYIIEHFLKPGAVVQRQLGVSSEPEFSEGYLPWLAGFFDGEGCISVVNPSSGFARVQISLSQSAIRRNLLEEVQRKFGGGVYDETPPGPGALIQGSQPTVRWQTARQSDVVFFLASVRPYLRAKHAEADAALARIGTPRVRGKQETILARAAELGSEAFAHFTFDHTLNGIIEAQGEDAEDRWQLIVEDNLVRRRNYVFHLEGS